jgi:Fe-S cluster assembly ATP-binding protein
MAVLEVKNLSLTLDGKRILNDLSIDFWEGHVHAVVGPNGAGKSTLAFTIMGLAGYRDVEGEVIFEGESLLDLNVDERARRGITLAWQEPAREPLDPTMPRWQMSERDLDDLLEFLKALE